MTNVHLPLKCPYLLSTVVFSYRYEMKVVSVILLQYQKHAMSVNLR